jgi:putative PIN family toxin of toxin-antitoxin system
VRIVLDTNVLVSALLSPSGTPARVLALVLSGAVTLLHDDRILAEYREVLARPRLAIPPAEADLVLDYLAQMGVLVVPTPLRLELADPDDAAFVETSAAAHADALVTGNLRHYAGVPPALRLAVVTPAEFMERWHELHG